MSIFNMRFPFRKLLQAIFFADKDRPGMEPAWERGHLARKEMEGGYGIRPCRLRDDPENYKRIIFSEGD